MTNKTWMYKFDVTNKVNKDNGETVEDKVKLALLKPNRKLKEDGELFYAKEVSRFAKAGVLPKAAWGTILSDGGGSISEKEREVYGELLLKFRDASFELQSILIKTESERTEAEKKRSDEIRKEIQSFESSQISIFENTAEAKARNRTILWWVLFTSYIEKNGEYVSFFDGETFDEKLNSYDIFEDSNSESSINLISIRRLTYLITLWFLGKVETEEDFDSFYQNLIKESEEVFVEEKSEEKAEIISTEKTVEEKVVVEKIETTNTEEAPSAPATPVTPA